MLYSEIIDIYVWDYWQEKHTFFIILEIITKTGVELKLIQYSLKD